jgi:hypothetical protein
MGRASATAGAGLALALLAASCGDLLGGGGAPTLTPMDDVTVLVGEKLNLLVEATDPDGDSLKFYINGRPDRAQFVAMPGGTTAAFTWIPEVTDSAPGGKAHEVEFVVEDDAGAWDSQTLVITVLPQWAPQFLNPPGYVLDLAEQQQVEFILEVKDDSASHVAIAVATGPPNAYLKQTEKKRAYFSWRPTEEQTASKLFWYVTFTASGYVTNPSTPNQETLLYQIEHNIIIVIINSSYEGCTGSMPQIEHTVATDYHPSAGETGMPVTAAISDSDSFVAQANVLWTTGSPSNADSFQALAMAESNGQYVANLPPLAAGAGLMVHYYIQAVDNDDYAGVACDHTARLPKQGFFTSVLYDPGFSDACLEDGYEDNDSEWAATPLDPGQHPALRLCPGEHDYYRFPLSAPSASVAIDAYGDAAAVVTDVLDGDGNPVHGEVYGTTSFAFPASALAGGAAIVHVHSVSGAPATYTLTVGVEEQQCTPDSIEPNDQVGTAPLIGEGEYSNLSICAGDLDYYRVEVPSGNVVSVLVDFSAAAGDLDAYLLAGDGQDVLVSAQTTTDDEVIEFGAVTGGTYYILVKGVAGASNAYNMTVTVSAPAEQCLDDSFAPNGYPEMAAMVPVGTYNGLVLCAGKQDWFATGLNGGETLTVEATGSGSGMSAQLFDAATGAPVCSGAPGSTGVTMTCTIPGPGIYAFYLASSVNQNLKYSLTVSVKEDMTVCTEDRFESNDNQAEAADIIYTITTWGKACGQDPDWFRFEGYPMEQVLAAVGHDPELGAVDLSLYAPDGQTLLAMTDTADGIEYLEYNLVEYGLYYLVVKGADFYGNVPYDLFLWLQ